MYRSRRELARDEQTYYERFYSADTNETAVKNTVASIASLAALLLARSGPARTVRAHCREGRTLSPVPEPPFAGYFAGPPSPSVVDLVAHWFPRFHGVDFQQAGDRK